MSAQGVDGAGWILGGGLFALVAVVGGAALASSRDVRVNTSSADEDLAYVAVTDNRGHMKIYGPFLDEESAIRANFFRQPESDRSRLGLRQYVRNGVSRYSKQDVRELCRNPQEYGIKRCTLCSASDLRVHKTWTDVDPEVREYLYEEGRRV